MIDSYFFVPAHKKQFIAKSEELPSIDYRIFDLEDSVAESNLNKALNLIKKNFEQKDWVRLPISDNFESVVQELFKLGSTNYILPKIQNKDHFKSVIKQLLGSTASPNIILLIENPKIYLDIEKIFDEWQDYITGIGLGSHDFCAKTGIKHSIEYLHSLRLKLSILAKAYNVIPIDIASMNISNIDSFNRELQDGFDLGYRAKFLLHPFQLKLLNNYAFFTIEEVDKAKKALLAIGKSDSTDEVVVKLQGRIFEKPHVNQLKEIVNWGKHYYGTDR